MFTIIRVTQSSQLQDAFDIRKKVFVEEQGVPLEDEFDQFEEVAQHLVIYCNGMPIGTGRVRMVEDFAKLERICILPEYRKQGLGKEIIQELESISQEQRQTKVKLHAQVQAQGFYEKLGYICVSEEPFIEDGILHVLMEKELTLNKQNHS